MAHAASTRSHQTLPQSHKRHIAAILEQQYFPQSHWTVWQPTDRCITRRVDVSDCTSILTSCWESLSWRHTAWMASIAVAGSVGSCRKLCHLWNGSGSLRLCNLWQWNKPQHRMLQLWWLSVRNWICQVHRHQCAVIRGGLFWIAVRLVSLQMLLQITKSTRATARYIPILVVLYKFCL